MFGELIGSLIGAGASLFGASKDRKAQKEFAQNGLQWRTQDALNAGIHPLAAIGFNGPSYSPVYGNIGSSLAGMGQGIDRAVEATMSGPERGLKGVMDKLQLRNAELQNSMLEAQIADIKRGWSPGTAPARPGAGSTISGSVIKLPGGKLLPIPPSTNASDMQNEFGEGIGDSYGWLRGADAYFGNPKVKAGTDKFLEELTGKVVRATAPRVPSAVGPVPANHWARRKRAYSRFGRR